MQEMKYFNEGNDCDICKNQLMTGRDGTVEDCRRRQNGLSCRFEERDIRTCPVCEHEVDREDMYFTTGRRAGVEKAHPHRFRGTALTNALNRGMPLQEASILAGHAKTETTMLYCTVDQESVKYHHKKYLSA